MKERSTRRPRSQGRCGRRFAWQDIQRLSQQALEDEGSSKSWIRSGASAERGPRRGRYRNGYGKPRRLSLSVGTVTVRWS